MSKLNWSTTNSQITDEIINVSSSAAFNLYHDVFYNKTGKLVVISTGAGGSGTVLTLSTDYTIGGAISDGDLPASISPDVAYTTIAITNAAYHSTDLYVSYYPLGDYVEAPDVFAAGMIMPYAGATAPSGWLDCDGSAISRATYNGLYKAIGTAWGVGDGSTTFNLPDLRGVFLRGAGANGTLTDANSDAFDGGSVGDTANDKFQGHKQESATLGGVALNNGTADGTNVTGAALGAGTIASRPRHLTGAFFSDGTNGTPRTGNETQPVNATVLYIIKA